MWSLFPSRSPAKYLSVEDIKKKYLTKRPDESAITEFEWYKIRMDISPLTPPTVTEIVHDFVTGTGLFVSPKNRSEMGKEFLVKRDSNLDKLPEHLKFMANVIGNQDIDSKTNGWLKANDKYTPEQIQRQAVLKTLANPSSNLNQFLSNVKRKSVNSIDYSTGSIIGNQVEGNTCGPEKAILCLLLRLVISFCEKPVKEQTEKTEKKITIKPFVLEAFPENGARSAKTKLKYADYINARVESETLPVLTQVLKQHLHDLSVLSDATKKMADTILNNYDNLKNERTDRLGTDVFQSVSLCEIENLVSENEIFDVLELSKSATTSKIADPNTIAKYEAVSYTIDETQKKATLKLRFSKKPEGLVEYTISALPEDDGHYKFLGILGLVLIPFKDRQDSNFTRRFFRVMGAYVANVHSPLILFKRVAYENSMK